MPDPSCSGYTKWPGTGDIDNTLFFQFAQFKFEDEIRYRPIKAEGYVWDTQGRPRADLLTLSDLALSGLAGLSNPTYSIAGHLIAVALNGIDRPENLVPVSKQTNDKMGAVEFRIRKLVPQPRYLEVEIARYYDDPGADPRIPAVFQYTLREAKGSGNVLLSQPLVQDWLQVGPVGVDQAAVVAFQQAEGLVGAHNWLIENVTNSPLGGLNFSFLKGALPTADRRPCRTIDFLALERKGGGFLSEADAFEYAHGIGCGREFSASAKSLALFACICRHGGWLASDAYRDPRSYLEIGGSAVIEQHGALIHGGGHNAPQVDHIIPQQLGGPNCLSNAQVTSMQYNVTKGKNTAQLALRDPAWIANMTD
ncbi:MAG: hypothetical protein ACRD4O_15440, partial [Bryobacteraceae bacterium]